MLVLQIKKKRKELKKEGKEQTVPEDDTEKVGLWRKYGLYLLLYFLQTEFCNDITKLLKTIKLYKFRF